MKVICDGCKTIYKFDASKVPVKGVTTACKKCKGKIVIKPSNLPTLAGGNLTRGEKSQKKLPGDKRVNNFNNQAKKKVVEYSEKLKKQIDQTLKDDQVTKKINHAKEKISANSKLIGFNRLFKRKSFVRLSCISAGLILFLIIAFNFFGDNVRLSKIERLQWEAVGFSIDEAKNWKRSGFNFNEAVLWKNQGFSLEDSRNWKSSGYKFPDANRWNSSNFTLTEANKWKQSGFNVSVASNWNNEGFNLDEAIQWEQAGFDYRKASKWKEVVSDSFEAQELIKIGFERRRPEQLLCFKDKGFAIDEIKILKINDFDCKEALKWKQASFTVAEMVAFAEAGFNPNSSFSNAKKWKAAGFSLDEIKELKNSGFSEYASETAKKFKEKGYSTAGIVLLKNAQIDYNVAISWKKHGFTAEEIVEFVSLGIRHGAPRIAKSWRSTGLTLSQIKSLIEIGFNVNSPNKILYYQNKSIAFKEIVDLKKAGFTENEVNVFIEEKIKIADVIKWSLAGWKRDEIKEWLQIGIALEEAEKWKKAGFSSKKVKGFTQAGISFSDAEKGITASSNDVKSHKGTDNNSNIITYAFRKTNWGFTKKEVIGSEEIKFEPVQRDDIEGCDSYLGAVVELYGVSFKTTYGFSKDKLHKAQYEFSTAGYYIDAQAQNIFRRLNEKYGEPIKGQDRTGEQFIFKDTESNTVITYFFRRIPGMGDGLWITYEFFDYKKELQLAKKRKLDEIQMIRRSDQDL